MGKNEPSNRDSGSGRRVDVTVLLTLLLLPSAAYAQRADEIDTGLVVVSSLAAMALLLLPLAGLRIAAVKHRNPEFCPRCRNNDARPAHPHTLRGPLLKLIGCICYRCSSCKRRYYAPGSDDIQPLKARRTRVRTRIVAAEVLVVAPPIGEPLVELAADEPARALQLGVEARVRKRRRSGPSMRLHWIAAGAAALVVAVSSGFWMRVSQKPLHPGGAPQAKALQAATPPPEFDLVVAEASLIAGPKGKRIRGIVQNNSKQPYLKAEILFSADDRFLSPIQMVSAAVSALGPGASVSFESGPVPPKATRFHIKEIVGEKTQVAASGQPPSRPSSVN